MIKLIKLDSHTVNIKFILLLNFKTSFPSLITKMQQSSREMKLCNNTYKQFKLLYLNCTLKTTVVYVASQTNIATSIVVDENGSQYRFKTLHIPKTMTFEFSA